MKQNAVIITGAGSGIGKACAERFAEAGFYVFLIGRDQKKLLAVAQTIEKSEAIVCDITDGTAIEKAAQHIQKQPYPVDVLVNNAGIFQFQDMAHDHDGTWMEQFNTNLFGAVRWTRALWPHWLKQKRGSILNVSSTLGLKPTAQTAAYSASKAAMINWTVSLAQQGAAHNIRANCVCPGIVDTPIHAPGNVAKMASAQPLGRVGTPKEIADAVYFLGSNQSAWTTGAILSVDGGIHIQ